MSLFAFGGSAQAADTVVTFGFDDGLTSQFVQRDILTEHGVDATFFINSGMVGNPNRISWANIATLAAEGHEIGGHTVDHAHLTALDQAGQQHQLCDDRTTLMAHGLTDGYTIRNVAYPFGQWNATTKLVAAGCGYDTGRPTGGTDYPEGPIYAETFPPLNAYTLRAIEPRLDTPLDIWQDIVQKARDSGGGWVNIVMHDLCDLPCTGFDQFSVSTERFEEVLDWLDTLPDVKIRTTEHALAVGTDVTAPVVTLTAPADGGTVTETVTLTADATDAVGVDRVDFRVDGDVVGSDATAPYSFDWDSSVAGDSAAITAEAFDEAGHATLSAVHTVTVIHPDVTPPTVDLTAPEDADTVTGTVTLAADADDDRGIVDHVDFLVDGDVVGSDDSEPYSFDWESAPAGDFATITAEAFDPAGNSTISGAATVAVSHPVDPPLDPPIVDPPIVNPPIVNPPIVDPPVAIPPILNPPPVVDTRKPSVRVADVVLRDDQLLVIVDARDAGGVRAVRVQLPGHVVRTDTRAPFAIAWRARSGRHVITADAVDRAGNRRRSAPVRVDVRRVRGVRGARAIRIALEHR